MPEISGTDIENVIAGIKRAINAAEQSDGGAQTIKIEKLELYLKCMVERKAGGELKIKIPIIDTSLGLSGGFTSKELQTIQLTLVPIESRTRPFIRPEVFEKELIEAIRFIREGIRNAAVGEPEFTLENAFVEFNFVVNSNVEISLLAKGSGQSEVAQTVKLFLASV
jgi:hypothetical protein